MAIEDIVGISKVTRMVDRSFYAHQLKKTIAELEAIGELDEANNFKEELQRIMAEEGIILDVTEDEYEASTSKFAAAGEHLSEMGLPNWENKDKRTIRFPFTIIEEGPDFGKEGKIVAGTKPDSIWKFKEVQAAVGFKVEYVDRGDGVKAPKFNPAECVGKQFLSVWTEQKDSRSLDEGGTGHKYTKPESALPVGSKSASVM